MSIITKDEILGYVIDKQFVCADCATDDEADAADQDQIVVKDDESDDVICCDRCKHRIQ